MDTGIMVMLVVLIAGIYFIMPYVIRSLGNKGYDAIRNAKIRSDEAQKIYRKERLAFRYYPELAEGNDMQESLSRSSIKQGNIPNGQYTGPHDVPVISQNSIPYNVLENNQNYESYELEYAEPVNVAPRLHLVRIRDKAVFDPEEYTFTIGSNRNKSDYVVSEDRTVSRCHATVFMDNNCYFVIDNSSNGTWINGNRLQCGIPCPLNDGDTIVLAKESFWVQIK